MPKRRRSRRPMMLKLLGYVENWQTKDLVYPPYEKNWSYFYGQMAKVVSHIIMDNTWDASSLEDWDWDAYHQRFTFYVHSSFRMGKDMRGQPVEFKSRFTFNPKVKDMIAECDRLAEDIKKYSDNLLFMQRAYHAALETGQVYALDPESEETD